LEANLTDLVGRLKRKAYRARLVRRKYIPKGNGKLRPLGIPVLEDKLLQMAVTQILLVIYEMDFLPCSYGYRPGKSAHEAIRALSDELQFRGHQFVVEADIKGFLDPYSYYTLAAAGWSKSCGWLSKMRIRKPFCLPRLT
jgi:RNA-directed DNA polymerase